MLLLSTKQNKQDMKQKHEHKQIKAAKNTCSQFISLALEENKTKKRRKEEQNKSAQ